MATTPSWARPIVGERPRAWELVTMLIAGLMGGAVWASQVEQPSWGALGAAILVTDVVAGCISNFSRSTQRFYEQKPRLRWLFIAMHVHIVAIAFLAGEPLRPALMVWLATMLGASIANVFRDSMVVGATVLVSGLSFITSIEQPRAMAAVGLLYFVKVAFAFSTKHHTS